MPQVTTPTPRKHHVFHVALCTALAFSSQLTTASQSGASTLTLYQNFQDPPDDAKPMMRWWWFGAAVTRPEILRELQQMKADGIGGVELAFVYPEVLDDPSKGIKNLPFLSPEFLDCVHYAQQQARALGLRVDITLGSGWPYGGPATTLAQAAHHLRTIEIPVPPHTTSIPTPTLTEGETLIAAFLATPIRGGQVIPDKTFADTGGKSPVVDWDSATTQPLTPSGPTTITPDSDKPRTALFFVDSHTRQQVKRAAVGAEGYVLDPFSHDAVATHLQSVAEPLVQAFGPTPPYAVFSDSLEAYGADWTPDLPAQFRQRRGYDLLPHLPELVAGNTPEAANIRHDWGVTLTELVNQNYVSQINTWALAHHTKFRSQTYGEPAVSFSSQHLASLPEGEGPQWRAFSTLRWATSANHVFGNNITSGETFTWLHSPVFRATPLDMKAEADIDFITGENQIIGHGWPYSPPASELTPGDPGWSLYAAAALNDHNPWHPVMPAVTRYIQRVSYLLRQGQPANQVALLLPTDDAWAAFTPAKVTVTGAMSRLITPALMSAILSSGYNVDFIDAQAIDTVGLGSHTLLILPPTDRIPLTTLRKIQQYTAAGGKVVAVGRAPSIDPEGKTDPGLTALSHQLFSVAAGTLVPDESHLEQALQKAAMPDLALSVPTGNQRQEIGYIRRKLPTADIYFVVNTANHPNRITAVLSTSFHRGQDWNADTGFARVRPVFSTNLTLDLAPYESRILVFDQRDTGDLGAPPPERQLADLTSDWHVTFPTIHKSVTEPTLTDWTADPATLHYSGEAIYTRDVTLTSPIPNSPIYLTVEGGQALPGAPNSVPQEHVTRGPDGLPNPLKTGTGPGMHAWYDPPIREAGLVTINGQPAGALWHPPYRLEISRLLKPGENHIEIQVYNTALNAWSALPPRDYKPLIAKYGDRFQMQDLKDVHPLPSGILGPIYLVAGGAQ